MANDDSDPTEDMVKKEIAAAIAIFKEDHIIKNLGELRDRVFGNTPGGTSTTEGTPPPASDPPRESAGDKKKRKGLWWGEYETQ